MPEIQVDFTRERQQSAEYRRGAPGPQGEGMQDVSGASITDEWLREIVQSFRATSTTRDSEGRVASQQGTYRDGSAGTLTIARSSGTVDSVTYTHADSGKTLEQAIERTDGRYSHTTETIT